MKQVTIAVEDYLYEFYQKIGQSAGGLSTEQVMSDALLKLQVNYLWMQSAKARTIKAIFEQ